MLRSPVSPVLSYCSVVVCFFFSSMLRSFLQLPCMFSFPEDHSTRQYAHTPCIYDSSV